MRIILILITIELFSCTPEKRIARIANKYNLAKSDTIRFVIHDTIPEINISAEFQKDTSTAKLDSSLALLFEKYKVEYPSIDLSAIKNSLLIEMRSLYSAKKVFPNDTMVKLVDGFTIKLFETENGIEAKIKKPQETKSKEYDKIVNSVNLKDNGFSFIKTFITGNIVSILMLITMLYILFKNRS